MTVRMIGRIVREAILHCAAIPTGWLENKDPDEVRAIINGWHLSKGWDGIGYHYLVFPDGLCLPGRDVSVPGAHTVGRNGDSVGVLLLESRKITRLGAFYDYFTEPQRLAVRGLMMRLGLDRVSGHNDHARKLCPGFRVEPAFFAPINEGTLQADSPAE